MAHLSKPEREMIGGSLVNGSCRKKQEVLYDKNEATIEAERNKKEGKQVKQADSTPVSDWRKLFAASKDQALKFFPPQSSEGRICVAPSKEVFEEGEQKWKNAIVA